MSGAVSVEIYSAFRAFSSLRVRTAANARVSSATCRRAGHNTLVTCVMTLVMPFGFDVALTPLLAPYLAENVRRNPG
jgi:hypothetical protein